jgi:hypothetical protein
MLKGLDFKARPHRYCRLLRYEVEDTVASQPLLLSGEQCDAWDLPVANE